MYGVGFGYGAIGATKRSVGGLIYPLDAYGGAVAAYSLRKLSSTYTGNCIRVRRSSDNTEQDIGFVANVLDSTSLLTFCGSGNGFVTTWYDQSGTGRNNTQTTASLQPQIVVSGVVNKLNNKPSILWSDTSDKYMLSNSAITATSLTIAAVYSSKSYYSFTKLLSIGSDQPGSGVAYITFSGGDQYDFKLNDFVFFGNGYNLGTPRIVSFGKLHPDNLQTYGFLNSNSGSSNMYINGSEISYRVQQTGNINVGNGFLRLGNSDIYAQQLRGNMQEIIIYASNQSSNRAGINTNINTYYGIY